MIAEPNANYIEHCHWLLALPLSVTATHSLSSRSWHVILSGYATCDRRSERELYRTLSLAACASAKCHLHPFAQQSFRARNSFEWEKCDRVTETFLSQFQHFVCQNAFASGALPRTPLGGLQRPTDPQLESFGSRQMNPLSKSWLRACN